MEYDWDELFDDEQASNRCSIFFDEAYEMWLSAATDMNERFRWGSLTITASVKTMSVLVGKHMLRLPLN